MKNKKSNKKKIPDFRIDPSLDKYNDQIISPEKLKKANDTLRRIGLPKVDDKEQQ